MIQYKRLVNNIVTNVWTSDLGDATYTEPGWGSSIPYQVLNVPVGVIALSTVTVIDIPAVAEVDSSPAVLDANGNIVTPAVVLTPAIPAVTHIEYIIPADYTITQTDITAQLAQQVAIQKGMLAQQLGAQVIAAVYALNTSAGVTIQQIETMMTDASLATAERLLFNGSLDTALTVINASTTLSTLFTSAQITQITALINSYIAQLDQQ